MTLMLPIWSLGPGVAVGSLLMYILKLDSTTPIIKSFEWWLGFNIVFSLVVLGIDFGIRAIENKSTSS